MKPDITSRNDIEILVAYFYGKLLSDEVLQNIFQNTVMEHLRKHLGTIADFWDSILLDSNVYRGNVTEAHYQVDKQFPMNKTEFEHWLLHWKSSVDELYEGEKAEMAKYRAQTIADIMQYKLDYVRKIREEQTE